MNSTNAERYRRSSVATLGDPSERGITCSEAFVVSVLKPERVIPCNSFEDAAQEILKGDADFLAVPGAYRNVANFIQSADLVLIDVVVFPLPPLVVAGTLDQQPARVSVLFYQPAVECMIAETGFAEIEETEAVTSNAAACYAVKRTPGVTACITNGLCAARIGLVTYKTLRPAQLMPWLIFAKKGDAGNGTTAQIAA